MTTAVLETPQTTKKTVGKVHMPLASLQAALTKISPAIPGASCGIPILRTVRIENMEDGTTFTATDLDLSIRAKVTRIQDAAEPFLLGAERLMGYVKLLQGEDVSITPGEKRASLRCGRSNTQLPLDIVANYPQTAFGSNSTVDALTMPQSLALRMLQHTSFAISTEESRYTLNGALLECFDGKVRMVATDGHRMALYTAPLEGVAGVQPHLLPFGLIKALAKALVDSDDLRLTIADTGSSLALSLGGEMAVDMTSRKLAGQFPNYKAVLPSGPMEVRATVNSTELLASLNRCVAMSDRRSFAVKLTISPASIQMWAVDSTAGETEESIDVESAGHFDKFVTGFNGQYLVDVLKHSKGDVRISFAKAANQTPMVVSSEPEEGETFEYVVMPMRV